jgi:ORF6N domain
MQNKDPDIRILTIRDQKVVLDSDLARVYGVPTRTLNQALARNKNRFPRDFAFRLSGEEYEAMRSQIVIASSGPQDFRSQIVTGSAPNRSGRKLRPDGDATSDIALGRLPNMARFRRRTSSEAIGRSR